MWRKFFGFFRRKGTPPKGDSKQEVLEELRAIKKLARKHGALLEKMREEFLDQSERKLCRELDPLLDFADAFFYFARSLHESGDLSPQRRQALEMVWEKLDGVLASSGIQMVRQRNVPFDERLHEAIENMSPGKLKLQVLDMVQAGYTCNGRVVRAARVIVGNDGSNSDDGDIYESETEDVTRHAENNLRD